MVANLIKWKPWLPLQSKKFEAKIVVRCITGLQKIDDDEKSKKNGGFDKLKVEIKWKGSKINGIKSLRKKIVKKNSTRVQELGENGVVSWEEEFKTVCGFFVSKDRVDEGGFLPWEILLVILNDSQMNTKKKRPLAAPAVVNLAEFASLEGVEDLDVEIPLSNFGGSFKCCPSLCISIRLTELRTTNELQVEVQKPIMFVPLSPCFCGASPSTKKDEGSTFKARMRKVKSLTNYVSSKKSRKASLGEASSDSKFSTGSDSEYNYPFDTDSLDESEVGESEESRDDTNVEKSCGYGNLVDVNLAGGGRDPKVNCEDDELVYYSNKQLDKDSSPGHELDSSISEQVLRQNPRFRILAWRKRKLSFRTPRVKGEPLLKKDNEEEGGDDIDFDRRQLSSDDSMAFGESVGSGSLFSEFGDDNFAVGSWEVKELPSRDGSMKLKTQVFFASIDQRSERAAGESACTALVAVIADWIHTNRGEMPIKSDFDSLIREGSLQWRSLCENEEYKQRFPDKHFDLETVLEAKIRPLTVVPEKSFIGFFHPEGMEEECFHFLKGAMSFDDIWGEICQAALKLNHTSEPLVYVVSWNDHFFLLRVDWDAFYIIDTLGERLFEGNNQAFVLKFDMDTVIERVPDQTPTKDEKDTDGKSGSSTEKTAGNKPMDEKSGSASPVQVSEIISAQGSKEGEEDDKLVVRGKECCKEYITSFLAAIPLRELQVDMKKGLMSSTPLHHRLQIEFNYTSQIVTKLDDKTDADMTPVTATNIQASGPELTIAVEMQPPFGAAVQGSMTSDVPASMMAVVAG
ncbi:hypothetical protein RND81_09G208400 [Saponaria officinalis]|uniref:C2 NT-type domain-containing protein n=1 Tax=Saponaria officinalis TaxID=3572 RepID=A0AAW1IQB9_SAPOF